MSVVALFVTALHLMEKCSDIAMMIVIFDALVVGTVYAIANLSFSSVFSFLPFLNKKSADYSF